MQSSHQASGGAHISTGTLPPGDQVRALVNAAYTRFKNNHEGHNAQYYPALAAVPAELFGICVAGVDGSIYAVGDDKYPFTIMSVAKPFVFALVCQALGPDQARAQLGVNATGLAFNSVVAIELGPAGRTNPMVNAGAIATTSLVPGATAQAKWHAIHNGLSRFAGRPLTLDEEIYASASRSNHRNQAIARLLEGYGCLHFDTLATLDLYTRQSALNVTARDLAVMAATLADGGVNPATRERKRRRRWHHHRCAGQRRASHICATARRGRQQRQGAAHGALSFRAAWFEPVRLAADGLVGAYGPS
jgi:glutaminase